MRNSFSKGVKKLIISVSLASFLLSPVSYVFSMNQVSAATPAFAKHHDDRDKDRDHWDKDRQDHYKDNKKDDDKDYDRGDVTAAVLIGGVIGAIIAKNTWY